MGIDYTYTWIYMEQLVVVSRIVDDIIISDSNSGRWIRNSE